MTVIKMKVHLENILHYREVNHDCSHDFKNMESSNNWSIKLMAALQIGLSKKKSRTWQSLWHIDAWSRQTHWVFVLYPFPLSHNPIQKQLNVLDLIMDLNDGFIVTHIYLKPTDSHLYLEPSSSHHSHCKNANLFYCIP